MRIQNILIVSLIVILTGCGTAEWQAENNACLQQAYQQYPPNMQTTYETKFRTVEKPTGVVNCTSTGNSYDYQNSGWVDYSSRTNCTPEYTYIVEEYQVPQSVDMNKNIRNDMRRRCTRSACLEKYGNADCKVETGEAQNTQDAEPNLLNDIGSGLGNLFN